MARSVLVTGGAGFIGSHLAERLLAEGWRVTALDSFDDFYDPMVKRRNAERLRAHTAFSLVEADVRDADGCRARLAGDYDVIVHLAAKAGVRPSLERPLEYQDVNGRGTHVMLELARHWGVKQFVFASSSSVYGENPDVPWSEERCAPAPISPYAATKAGGELLGRSYSHLFGIRFLALRLFTVYGPRQRPDLAIHSFARRLRAGDVVPLFGGGASSRDYTFVSDVVAGIRAAMDYRATPFETINVGGGSPVSLLELLRALSDTLGLRPTIQHLPEQPGDVPRTWADIGKAGRLLGYRPAVALPDGLRAFAEWLDAADGARRSAPAVRLPAAAVPLIPAARPAFA